MYEVLTDLCVYFLFFFIVWWRYYAKDETIKKAKRGKEKNEENWKCRTKQRCIFGYTTEIDRLIQCMNVSFIC